jgi:hypothetical protein
MSLTYEEKDKRKEGKKEEKATPLKKIVLSTPPLKDIVFKKIVYFKRIKTFLPIPAPRLELTVLHLSKLSVRPSRKTITKIIKPPYFILSAPPKIIIPISKFFMVNSSKSTPIILPMTLPIQMKMPKIESFHFKLSSLIREPKLKSKPLIFPSSKILLNEKVKIQTQLVQIRFTLPVKREEVKEEVPIEKVKAKVTEPKISTEILEESEELDLLDKIFKPIGRSRELNFQRPLCIIVRGDSNDGLKMLEHLMSTIYTYRGEYGFSMKLPWQPQEELSKPIRFSSSLKEREDPYSLIVSEHLIVTISQPNKENKPDIERGLREISKRGAKCVIVFTHDIKPFEDLERDIPDVDIVFRELSKYNEEIKKLIEKLLGITISNRRLEGGIDRLWGQTVRLYEEMLEELDDKLSTKGVDQFDRESKFHYILKKIVYWALKEQGYEEIETEKPEIIVNNEKNTIEKIIPDIIVNKEEFWEIETGYPAEEEKERIKDVWNPESRLIAKLRKYIDSRKIRVVVPAIYAHLFKHELRKVKKYFIERDYDLKFYTIQLLYKEVKKEGRVKEEVKGELKKLAL